MKQLSLKKIISCALISFCLAFTSSSFFLLPIFQHWHDQQRIAQIVLSAVCAFVSIFITVSLPKLAKALVFAAFFLGGLSAAFAAHPVWALYEWATYLGLFFVAAIVCYSSVSSVKFNALVLAVLAFATVVNSLQFITVYLAAVFSGLHNFNAAMLYSGFSNPRFLNQFQALSLPVLGYLFFEYCRQHFPYAKALAGVIFISLLTQWVIAFTLGGRGLWLALTVSNLMLIGFFPRYWRLLVVQLIAGLLAWLLYYLMFTVIPDYLGVTPNMWDNLRSGLSSREIIWQLAWDMFKAHPWLGAGPMHFSASINAIAAHPHQIILQWLAEWGLLATAAAISLAGWGMLSGLKYIRQAKSTALDAVLWMSILNALVLAQVDGVFVMPYTVTWLAILIGLAWARWPSHSDTENRSTKIIFKLAAVIAFAVFLHILFVAVPNYFQMNSNTTEQQNDFAPRFWAQGFIPHASLK